LLVIAQKKLVQQLQLLHTLQKLNVLAISLIAKLKVVVYVLHNQPVLLPALILLVQTPLMEQFANGIIMFFKIAFLLSI
jgi:hypothetical protein